MGATTNPEGETTHSILQSVVKIAYEELGLFHEQVDLLRKYKSQNEKAKNGAIDFFLKVVHQFDRGLAKLCAQYGAFSASGHFGVLPGKGSGLWLSVPITRGDVVCFVDADITNFEKEFVTSLCHPIIYSWHTSDAAVKFVKAYYNRVTVSKGEADKVIYGGRVSRLLARPLLKTVVEVFGLYPGLESIRHPISGEFAISRDILKRLNFSNTYAVETSMMFQTHDMIGSQGIAQLNLDVFGHIGQEFEGLERMALQISRFIHSNLEEKLGRSLTGDEKEQLLNVYEGNVMNLLEEYATTAESLKKRDPDLDYSQESDLERIHIFKEILRESLYSEVDYDVSATFNLPSWRRIGEKTESYFVLRELLRRRTNQSTWTRLMECGLVDN